MRLLSCCCIMACTVKSGCAGSNCTLDCAQSDMAGCHNLKHPADLLVGGALFERLQHQLRRPALHLAVHDDEALEDCSSSSKWQQCAHKADSSRQRITTWPYRMMKPWRFAAAASDSSMHTTRGRQFTTAHHNKGPRRCCYGSMGELMLMSTSQHTTTHLSASRPQVRQHLQQP